MTDPHLTRDVPMPDGGRWTLRLPTVPGARLTAIRHGPAGDVRAALALDPADLVPLGEALARAGRALADLADARADLDG